MSVTSPLATVADLAALIGLSEADIRALTVEPYRRFPKAKRDGSPRPMAEPSAPLKKAQRDLLDAVWYTFDVHHAAHGVPGRSALTNARVHRGASVFLKLDVAGFFPSIGAGRISGYLQSRGYVTDVADTIAAIATVPEADGSRWLPQGAPTSNAIANVLCRRLDARLYGAAVANGATYTRYVDDLTFSWTGETMRLAPIRHMARMILAEEGFKVNEAKLRVLRAPARITGYVVDDQELRTSRDVRRRLRAAEYNAANGRGDVDSLMGLRTAALGT